MAISTLGILVLYERQQTITLRQRVPENIRTTSTFPIYIPHSGQFPIKKGSFAQAEGGVSFIIESGSKQIIVTEQPRPAAFEIGKFFNSQGLEGARSIRLEHGDGILGSVSGKPVLLAATDKTVINAVSLNGASQTDLEDIVKDLTEVK